MTCDILLGGQWGDEGKAKVIDSLSGSYDMVVRYQGGANAGHTVVAEGKKYVFHLVPSGMLHGGMVGVLGNGLVLDLPSLLSEIEHLEGQGIDFEGRLMVSSQCFLVLPYHQELDRLQEGGEQKECFYRDDEAWDRACVCRQDSEGRDSVD